MSVPGPSVGQSHTVKFVYADGTKEIGMMIPDMRSYSRQPYTPFAPATRQGEATQRDFAIQSVWEIQNDWSGGTGHLIEDTVTETARYAFAQGLDLTGTTSIGACLFTGQRGRLYPAPKETVTSAITNHKQFIEFNGNWYALTSDAAGKIYKNDGSTTWTLVETLTAAGTQLYTDGTTLFACQGAANAVRKTTDGTSWSNHTFNAHFMTKREENNTSYITTATLTLGNDGTGPSYLATVIGLPGTTVTKMIFYDGKLWIGKPEGLYIWEQGWIRQVADCQDQRDTSNFKTLCVHKGLVWFNIKNKLYFTDAQATRRTEVLPQDINGFDAIDALFPTVGPLLISARLTIIPGSQRCYLFYFSGVDAPGLNPLWSDADGTKPIVACGATDLYTTSPRIYLCQTTTGTVWLDFKQNYVPKTYHTTGTLHSYVELTTFSAGFRSVPKWFYEVVLNVVDKGSYTFARIWYSIDEGTWTAMEDEDGNAVTALPLNAQNKGVFFPLNTTGVNIRLRIYLYTTDGTQVQAAITAVTIRGLVEPKKRVQISFPASADETVQGYNTNALDSGRNIKAAIEEMATQGYPIKFQDYDKRWYLVENRTPYPLESITDFIEPGGNAPAQANSTFQILLIVIDELDENGDYIAWSAG